MTLAELPQVAALSVEEKIQLVDELWLSMNGKLEHAPVSEEEKNLLDDRWERYKKNPETALTLEQCMALLEAHRARLRRNRNQTSLLCAA